MSADESLRQQNLALRQTRNPTQARLQVCRQRDKCCGTTVHPLGYALACLSAKTILPVRLTEQDWGERLQTLSLHRLKKAVGDGVPVFVSVRSVARAQAAAAALRGGLFNHLLIDRVGAETLLGMLAWQTP